MVASESPSTDATVSKNIKPLSKREEIKKEDDWIIVDGYKYDISEFKKRHPGGNVISFYRGKDASDVFHAFHFRSESATKYLKAIPKQKASESDPDDGKSPLVADFRKLREELVEEGAFEPTYFMQLLRTLELILIYGFAMFLARNGYLVLAAMFRALWSTRNGLLMHETGHRAFTGIPLLDKFYNWFFFCFWQGGSATFWNNQHNKHHAATQELGYDVDLNTLPLVAFNVEVAKKGNAKILQYQWIFFVPVQMFLFFFWKFIHTRHIIRTRNYYEIAGVVMHEIFEMSLLSNLSFGQYWFVTALSWALGAPMLATTFALNHTHKPVVPKNSERNWVVRSVEHTTNLTPTYFTTWFTGYLNYQVEHHLFPQIPHPRLPSIQKRVQAMFEKHNVHYDVKTITEAFQVTIQNLYEVGNWKSIPKYSQVLEQYSKQAKKAD